MQDLLLQAGGVMGLTYYIVDLIKAFLPESMKKYIPFGSAILAGLLNYAFVQSDFFNDFMTGLLMGFTASKGHDIKKTLSGEDLPTYSKDAEYQPDIPN